MTKKKKYKKPTKLSPRALQRKLLKLFQINPKKRYNAKQIVKKLHLVNNKDSVNLALKELASKKMLVSISEGRYKLNKDAPSLTSFDTNKGPMRTLVGTVDMTRSGDAFIIIPDMDDDVFISGKNLAGALDGDTVKIQAKLKTSKFKSSGKVLEIVERGQSRFIGKLFKFKSQAFVEVQHRGTMFQIDVPRQEVEDIPAGNSVKVCVNSWGAGNRRVYKGGQVEDLGDGKNNDVIMTEILYNNGFAQEFPELVDREAEHLSMVIDEQALEERRDFRGIFTITIDPETAKDFDDAISYQKLENGQVEIGVHIADVTHFMRPGTELDKEALNRSTSVYLVDRVAPMLPEMLSNDLCSLNPNEDKFCYSAVFVFNADKSIASRWFGRTIIHSDRRFTYEEAQDRIISGQGDYAEEIQFLDQLAKHMRADRFKNGSIAFQSEELRFNLDEDGKPIDVYVKESFDAHKLVEEYMLLANKEVALFISNKGKAKEIPYVYRVHDQPDMDKLADFAAFAKEMGIKMNLDTPKQIAESFNNLAEQAEENDPLKILEPLAIRTMAKAEYSTDNIGHYGLGFEHYAHFTSPIRRYADVLVHRILDANLDGKSKRVDKSALEATCKHISAQERKAVTAERESIKYKQVEWASYHIDEVFDGYISGMIDKGVFVTVSNSLVEGFIPFERLGQHFELKGKLIAKGSDGDQLKMGDVHQIRILSADLTKRQIELEFVESEE